MRHPADYHFRGRTAPIHVCEPMLAWVNEGRLPGDFLQAVLRNDLKTAIARADDESLAGLSSIVGWLYNEAPGNCWGSLEAVNEWAAAHRPKPEGDSDF